MVDCPERKTLDDFKDVYKSKLQAKLCPDRQLPDNDPIAILATVMAGLGFMQDGNMHRRFRSLAFVEEMCCEDLIKKADEEGIIQRPATSAGGCVQVSGNAGAIIPADMEISGSGNTIYSLDPSASNPSSIGPSGTATLCFTANEPGVDANLSPDTVLQTLESYPDIDGEVTVDETGFFGGSDAEDCESVRARLLKKRRGVQAPGTQEWYLDRVLEYPGVTSLCFASCECSECGGCCKSGYIVAYPIFEGQPNGIAPQGQYQALTDYIFGSNPGDGSGIAPLGAQGEFLQPTALETNVVISTEVEPNPQQLSSIASAVSQFYDESLCVGDRYCVSDLVAAIKNSAPSLCIQSALITGLGVENTPASCPEYGQIPCGARPILNSIQFT